MSVDIKVEVDIKEEVLDHDAVCQQQFGSLDIKVEVQLMEEEAEHDDDACQQQQLAVDIKKENHIEEYEENLPVKCEIEEQVGIFKVDPSPSNAVVNREEDNNVSSLKFEINDDTFISPNMDFEDRTLDPLSCTSNEGINEDDNEDELDASKLSSSKDKREGETESFLYRGKWTYERIPWTGLSGKRIKKYKCSTCSHMSNNQKFMIEHVRLKHYQADDTETPVGPREFVYLQKWKYEKTRGLGSYNCLTCGHVVTRRALMHNHIFKVHCNGTPMCGQCTRLFDDQVQLDSHNCRGKKVPPRPRFSMTEVGDGKFLFYSTWPVHLEGHFYVCDTCGVKKKVKEAIAKHVTLTHEDPARHSCGICQKLFSSKIGLRLHLPIHRGSRRKYSKTTK